MLIALCEAGATIEEFTSAGPNAKGKDDPFAYVVGTVKRRREEAARASQGLHQGPMPQPPLSRKDVQLQTAALMTGAAPMPKRIRPITESETIDVDTRILPP